MKFQKLSSLIALATCTLVLVPANLAAQDAATSAKTVKLSHYTVKVLGTLGGVFSSGDGLNARGSVAGGSWLSGNSSEHAFIWQKGVMTDLGTLGGPNSDASEGPMINNQDEVVGFSDTLIPDPNAENFCGNFGDFPNPYTCLPFIWGDGVITALPTLGGNNGAAIAVNNRGQVAGVAQTDIPDPTCTPPLVLHFEPVVWEEGTIKQLPNVDGDPDGFVNGINGKGQLVGFTGSCFPVHAVLWEKGKARDLGSLGGAFNNIAFEINNQGQVVGQSDLSGDLTHHGFLWERGAMRDLGTLPDLPVSLAGSINNRGQIVGYSQDLSSNNTTAWIWQKGVMTELNTLIPADSHLFLVEALGINDRGEISGYAIDTQNSMAPAFLAIPCDDDHLNVEGCDYSMVDADTAATAVPAAPAPKDASPFVQGNPALRGPMNPMLRRFGPRFGPWNRAMGAERLTTGSASDSEAVPSASSSLQVDDQIFARERTEIIAGLGLTSDAAENTPLAQSKYAAQISIKTSCAESGFAGKDTSHLSSALMT